MSKKNLPWEIKRGYPLPLGVTTLSEGVNFALFSRNASTVTLVLESACQEGSETRYELQLTPSEHKTGDVWHILLETHECDFTYGYRVDSDKPASGSCFTHADILIDPYCHALSPRAWGTRAQYGKAPCCKIISHDFDWQDDRPLKTPLSETIIYELHIRGFTKQLAENQAAAGSYEGLMKQIPYLKQLGVTAVELMPITEFDENDNDFVNPETGEKLKNFWGYNPVSFFALKSGYAIDPENHINEFKTLVRELHHANIEVILDIVYNHSGEGGYDGTTSSFRGIDNSVYYLLDPEDQSYLNFSGCGNTLNCNHPVVRSLIINSLRYWVIEMHVDGFRFDLASILGRDQDGNVLANPPMIEQIAEDPVLRDTKIIAEAWDAAGLYQVGSFSNDTRWGEWNGRFRDDVRAFMAGHGGMVSRLASRFAGSSDLYQASRRGPLSSINFLTSHDGFSLYDLVSYNRKHNLMNGENNRDGDNHNLSWNSGREGTPVSPKVEELRLRRIRSMLTILMFSQGVPMICAGDEFAKTQSGNNNAWCQDNPISWLDWQLMEHNRDLLRFFQLCIALRRNHPVFRRENFFATTDSSTPNVPEEIEWQYLTPGEQNWSADCHGLGVLIHGKRQHLSRDDDFFIMMNGNIEKKLHFIPPDVPPNNNNRSWSKIIDTAAVPPKDIIPRGTPLDSGIRSIRVANLAVVVLQSLPEVL
ncbi:glycogen debranching protein GlgX [Desulfosediminicola ganghwensis]|uniref:glycogen debranching protein GlgX n=1 Tax=Desulfosediminicola ganghwensis TaxID=2569540 RepID=UPI0010ACBD33|nr:glycogen debranching protein GlgX [Desulfosediminicola ganghwensis]